MVRQVPLRAGPMRPADTGDKRSGSKTLAGAAQVVPGPCAGPSSTVLSH